MEAVVCNYRQSKHRQKLKHSIIKVKKVSSRSEAAKFVGKPVEWVSPSGKKLIGKVQAPHGNKGAMRVIFEHGLPGQALGKKVDIKE